MENRGSVPTTSATTRLASTRAARVSSTAGSSGRAQTCSAASRLQPPAKTARRANSACSCAVSRPRLQSTVARRVRCRSGRSTGPVPRTSSRSASRSSSAVGGRTRNRAVASSMASGTPSRRRQISSTAVRVLVVRVEVRPDGGRPLEEQRHRVGLRQRAHGELLLRAQPQHRATRDEDDERRHAVDQLRQVGGGRGDLLDVVQDQQRPVRSRPPPRRPRSGRRPPRGGYPAPRRSRPARRGGP